MHKERVVYLDLIKAVAIILVVFCHYVILSPDSILGNIVMAMAWGAVPCFFMVSGALMLSSASLNWKKYFHRFLKIYFILCIWKLVYLIYFSFLNTVTFSKADLVKYIFLFGDIKNVSTGLLWFMYAYITVLIIYPICWKLFQQGKEGKIILLFMAFTMYLGKSFIYTVNFLISLISQFFHINTLSISSLTTVSPFGGYSHMIVYFILGAFLHHYLNKLSLLKTHAITKSIVLISTGTFGLLFIKFTQTGTFAWNSTYLINGYLWTSTIVLSVGLFIFLKQVPGTKFNTFLAKKIGTQTMGIFYLHFLVLAYLNHFLYPLISRYYSFALNSLKTLVVVFICIILTMVFKKLPLLHHLIK